MKYVSIFFLFLIMSCSSTRHWVKVATDTDITPEKKSIVAPKMAILFPPQTKFIQGETVVRVDTLIHERYEVIRDTINGVDTVVKFREKTITKEVRIVDTIFQVDASTVYALQQEISSTDTKYKAYKTLSEEKDKSIAALKKSQNKWLWWLIGLAVVNIIYIVVKVVK